MLSHLTELTRRTKVVFLIHQVLHTNWNMSGMGFILKIKEYGGGFGYLNMEHTQRLLHSSHVHQFCYKIQTAWPSHSTSWVHCIYTINLPVKRLSKVHSILGQGEEVMHIPANSICWSNSSHTYTYSFTYVEHSQYIVLIWQEYRCVNSYIVVKCRHHVGEVVKTILLEHLQIQKILAHSSNGLYQCKSCTSYDTNYK